MPNVTIEVKAEVEGVTDIRPADPSTFVWGVKVRCTNCGEEREDEAYVSADETFEMPGSRGEANLVVKCRLCERTSSLNVDIGSIVPYSVDSSERWAPFVSFECRGIEPLSISITSSQGLVGDIVDSDPLRTVPISFEDDEFADYDEATDTSLGIYGWETRIAS